MVLIPNDGPEHCLVDLIKQDMLGAAVGYAMIAVNLCYFLPETADVLCLAMLPVSLLK